MRSLVLATVVALGACNCGGYPAGGRPARATPGGGGSAGLGGSDAPGGAGGEPGAGGESAGGGEACAGDPGAVRLHLVTRPEGGPLPGDFLAFVIEHRALEVGEAPVGFEAGRLLRIRELRRGPNVEHDLLYALPPGAPEAPVSVGEDLRLSFDQRLVGGRSAGAVLRDRDGALLWAAEDGSDGTLRTGAPDLELLPADPVCSRPDGAGTRVRRSVELHAGGAVALASPGAPVELEDGARFLLGAWDEIVSPAGPDAPAQVDAFVFAAGPACGGPAGKTCPPGRFCSFPGATCGFAGERGRCEPLPITCPGVEDPVCGCDRRAYGNACQAAAAGVSIASAGCAPPDGWFWCGGEACLRGLEYCEIAISDVGGEPAIHTCQAAPACAAGGCACLAGEPCGELCEDRGGGILVVSCPGG